MGVGTVEVGFGEFKLEGRLGRDDVAFRESATGTSHRTSFAQSSSEETLDERFRVRLRLLLLKDEVSSSRECVFREEPSRLLLVKLSGVVARDVGGVEEELGCEKIETSDEIAIVEEVLEEEATEREHERLRDSAGCTFSGWRLGSACCTRLSS